MVGLRRKKSEWRGSLAAWWQQEGGSLARRWMKKKRTRAPFNPEGPLDVLLNPALAWLRGLRGRQQQGQQGRGGGARRHGTRTIY